MFVFDAKLIIKRMKQKDLNHKQLARLTKEVDIEGKGVSDMTCYRITRPFYDPRFSTISMVCLALELSPKSAMKERKRKVKC
jgi:hypothetical protein